MSCNYCRFVEIALGHVVNPHECGIIISYFCAFIDERMNLHSRLLR